MEQLRGLIADTEEKRFKKSLFGIDKKEIFEYIEALEQSFKNSIYNYDKKLSEQANALTMALREKETLTEKSQELEERVLFLSVDVDQHKTTIVAENNALKQQIDALKELEGKNGLLMTALAELQTRCNFAEGERQGLLDTIKEKDEIISAQCRQNAESERMLKNEIEGLKTKYESARKIQLLNIQSLKENLQKIDNIVKQL